MANDAFSQLALAHDANFLERLKGACLVVALQITAEDPGVSNHANRLSLAQAILAGTQTVTKFAEFIVMRPNVLNFSTSYDFARAAAVTASGDADLQSQVSSDWNTFTTLP